MERAGVRAGVYHKRECNSRERQGCAGCAKPAEKARSIGRRVEWMVNWGCEQPQTPRDGELPLRLTLRPSIDYALAVG